MSNPRHIAFIMDGNSTWSTTNNEPLMTGYLTGMKTMAQTIIDLSEIGIEFATFYAFSIENWNRPPQWVTSFMNLALNFFNHDKSVRDILRTNSKFKVIGDITRLSEKLKKILYKYEEKTKNNTGLHVQIAISYSGRDEIVRAINRMKQNGIDITSDNISNNLDTAGIPDPDLIIRTSGKQRLSNFLLWQCAYSELYFSDVLWPDFNKNELKKAIQEYSERKRTYGK